MYSWDFYLITQRGLCECERQFTVNIVTFTCVVVMRHNLNNNIKISWWPTVHTLFSFAANANLLTIVNTSWNINFYLCIPARIDDGQQIRIDRKSTRLNS